MNIRLLASGVALVAAAGMISSSAPQVPAVKGPLAHAIERQRMLPSDAIGALQALRLMAAVQQAYRSTQGQYANSDELKATGYLDPQWPRMNSESYKASCEVSADDFVCFADSLQSDLPWFRVDATLRVRFEPTKRPGATSAAFE